MEVFHFSTDIAIIPTSLVHDIEPRNIDYVFSISCPRQEKASAFSLFLTKDYFLYPVLVLVLKISLSQTSESLQRSKYSHNS